MTSLQNRLNRMKLKRILDVYIDYTIAQYECADGGRDIFLPDDFICCTNDDRIRIFPRRGGDHMTYYGIDSVIDAISVKYSGEKQKL